MAGCPSRRDHALLYLLCVIALSGKYGGEASSETSSGETTEKALSDDEFSATGISVLPRRGPRLVGSGQVCAGSEYMQLGQLGWTGTMSQDECFSRSVKGDMRQQRKKGRLPCPFFSWSPPRNVTDEESGESNVVVDCRCFLECASLEAEAGFDTYSWDVEQELEKGVSGQSTTSLRGGKPPGAAEDGALAKPPEKATKGIGGLDEKQLKIERIDAAGSAAGNSSAPAGPVASFPPSPNETRWAPGRCAGGPRDFVNLAWKGMTKEGCLARAKRRQLGTGQCPFLSYSAAPKPQSRGDFCQCHQTCLEASTAAVREEEAAEEWQSIAAPYSGPSAPSEAETSKAGETRGSAGAFVLTLAVLIPVRFAANPFAVILAAVL